MNLSDSSKAESDKIDEAKAKRVEGHDNDVAVEDLTRLLRAVKLHAKTLAQGSSETNLTKMVGSMSDALSAALRSLEALKGIQTECRGTLLAVERAQGFDASVNDDNRRSLLLAVSLSRGW